MLLPRIKRRNDQKLERFVILNINKEIELAEKCGECCDMVKLQYFFESAFDDRFKVNMIGKIASLLKISPDSIHGIGHWQRVEKIGHYISDRNGADKKIISAFAYLHDIGRTVEYDEAGHGKRSADIAVRHFTFKELGLNEGQYEKLLIAISLHDIADARSSDLTIQTCWDADRLDLLRVHIMPDKNLLYTDVAKSDETFLFLDIIKTK